MKPNPENDFQCRIQAWIDGELDATEAREVAAQVDGNPAAHALAENLRSFSSLLRTGEPAPSVPETRDFYWSRIRQGIEKAEATAGTTSEPVGSSRNRHASPMRWLAWLIPAGAAIVATVLLVRPPGQFPMETASRSTPALVQHEVETPSDDVSSLTFYAAQDGMTVVWLGRLDFM